MPLCVSELISNREILNNSCINSIVVNSRTNSTFEMENLLNSANTATGMDNPLKGSSHQLINSRANSTAEMDKLLLNSSSQLINSSSSNSGSINLPLGPRGSWAPVVCDQSKDKPNFLISYHDFGLKSFSNCLFAPSGALYIITLRLNCYNVINFIVYIFSI